MDILVQCVKIFIKPLVKILLIRMELTSFAMIVHGIEVIYHQLISIQISHNNLDLMIDFYNIVFTNFHNNFSLHVSTNP